MSKMQSFMEDQLARGQFFFNKEQAQRALVLSDNAFHSHIHRLKKEKKVVLLGHGFYVIVPAEYRNYCCLPTHWIIDPYFQHLQKSYYIGLLSAAAFYGATQQQPMMFQVMVDHMRRPIKLFSNGFINFHVQRYLSQAQTQQVQTPTGYVRFSTRSQTMVDLVRFHKQAGYLNNVVLIIRDLVEDVLPEELKDVLTSSIETTVLQRLGYILDELKADHLSVLVESVLIKRRVLKFPLRPDVAHKEGIHNLKWNLIINDPLEIDA